MGIVSILLGILTFAGFTFTGTFVARIIINAKEGLAQSVTDLGNVSNTPITIVIIVIFAFIGLLIGMNLLMHGVTFRKKTSRNTSLGGICILLGVISLCCFTLVGFFISNFVIKYKSILSMFDSLTFLSTTSDALVYEVVLAIFAFIGLLVCTNMTMHGLVYKKVAKLQYAAKHKN